MVFLLSGQYLSLDTDHNGMLSKQELLRYSMVDLLSRLLMWLTFQVKIVCSFSFRYGTGTLTKVFVDRVFQECLTYEGEVVRV